MARNTLGPPNSHLGLACNHLENSHAEQIALLLTLKSMYRMDKEHPGSEVILWEQMRKTVFDQFERCVHASMPKEDAESFLKSLKSPK